MTTTNWGHEPEKHESEKPVAKKPDADKAHEKADPDTTIFLDGDPTPIPYPDAKNRPRRVVIRGQNAEHVGETVDGAWTYRVM